MIFNTKYIPNIEKDELEDIINNAKDNNMIDYAIKYKDMLYENKNIFSNEQIINLICKMNYSDLIITLYQINFLKLIEFIDLLIESLIQNIKIIPNFIQYISKLIFYLVKNKFPGVKTITIYSFIGQFIFINLLIPLFKNPFNLYLNDFVISDRTLKNLNIIFEIFTQLILGNLFISDTFQFYYKPFNRFFFEKIPKIFEFYKQLIKNNCSNKIEKFINEELKDDYSFNIIEYNNKLIISHRSFLFSINDIIILINNMNDIQNNIFSEKDKEDSKAYNIFKKINRTYYKSILNEMANAEKNNEKEKLVLFNDLLINPRYEKMLQIEGIKPYFYIKELKNISNKEDLIKNNIIKSKNYISGLLYNCRNLESSEFSSEKTLDILKEIKIFLKATEFVLDKSLPYEWYVNSLLECLVLLPYNLSNNDFYSFYEEIKKDINDSIKILDFYKITDCFGTIKYIKNSTELFSKGKNNIKDISLNEKVKNLIENNCFDVEIQYNNEFFSIRKIKNKKGQIQDKNYKYIKCNSLNSFIRKFPIFFSNQNYNFKSLKIIKNLNIPKELNDYINEFTKNVLDNSKITFTKEDLETIKNKIYDYVFKKLFFKIYPISPTEEDDIITNNCIKLSWTEAKHFFGNIKNNNYNVFMDDIKQLFNSLEKEKSPRLKLEIIAGIFKTIIKIKTFNAEQSGVDDILNILVFIFIQVKPRFIYSDIQYIELFQNIVDGDMENKFACMKSVCNIISNIKSNNLIGVTEEEFNKNYNNINK